MPHIFKERRGEKKRTDLGSFPSPQTSFVMSKVRETGLEFPGKERYVTSAEVRKCRGNTH